MTQPDLLTRRRLLRHLVWGLALSGLPLGGDRPWEPPLAWAGDDDRDDDGRDDDDGSNSGPGGKDDRDDDRDEDDGREDDDGGSGGGDRDGDRDDDDRDGSDRDGGGGRGPRNITVLYPDGWTERIVDGRYELLDHQRRLVVRRAATSQDFGRMIALR